MSTAVELRTQIERRTQVDTTFRWRDRHGDKHDPAKMETRHVFNTLKMIWNNTVPAYYHVGRNVRLYSFGPSYTKEYMIKAVYQLGHELTKRTLTSEQMSLLSKMHSYFTSVSGLLT
ncbi:hypothetical protein [Burkholderia ubonensis]|uniref:hypothetical protein n=1 Tax=Burkholderia ubonensis TaxID=101571 RepID=UPI00075C55B5|nr:hypothetical protein [Burkholderia ubonensis]KVZ62224.1 hypothetical protein WL19_30040 [Burkholderia ubonensis]